MNKLYLPRIVQSAGTEWSTKRVIREWWWKYLIIPLTVINMINIQLGDILQSVRDGNIFRPVAPFYRLMWSTFFRFGPNQRQRNTRALSFIRCNTTGILTQGIEIHGINLCFIELHCHSGTAVCGGGKVERCVMTIAMQLLMGPHW